MDVPPPGEDAQLDEADAPSVFPAAVAPGVSSPVLAQSFAQLDDRQFASATRSESFAHAADVESSFFKH
jgi:hypothetical protein